MENLYATWDVWFGKLKAFKDRFGHCKIPQNWEEPGLASWISRQRLQKDNLTSDQLKRLDEISFVWDLTGLAWDEMFAKLTEFKKRFGHCNVETKWEEDPALSGWVSAQRNRKSRGVLNDDKVIRLEELGFIWDYQKVKASATWLKWYQKLEDYAREHGDPHVLRTYSDKRLASWVWNQRQRRKGTLKKKGKEPDLITQEQIVLLDKLGFRWDAREDKWSDGFDALRSFKNSHGHCDVGDGTTTDVKLLNWVGNQKVRFSKGNMSLDHKQILDEIGFKWDRRIDERWSESYKLLVHYHAKHGNADVPAKWKENRKLASWVSVQRQRKKRNQIADEEIRLLDLLGFTWKSRDVGTWEDRLAEVAVFKAQNGHCEIPFKNPEFPKLGAFVNTMRTQRNNGSLSADRIAKLDALGFAWASHRKVLTDGDGISVQWHAHFDELLKYKQAYGNCDVPSTWPENPQLGNWVNRQRQLKKAQKLLPKQEEKLNAVGFSWCLGSLIADWGNLLEQLKAYKDRFGDCRVPRRWKENPQLGMWVSNRRRDRKNGILSAEKEELLADIGFE